MPSPKQESAANRHRESSPDRPAQGFNFLSAGKAVATIPKGAFCSSVARYLKDGLYAKRVASGAPVFMAGKLSCILAYACTAVLEYCCAEVLEVAILAYKQTALVIDGGSSREGQ